MAPTLSLLHSLQPACFCFHFRYKYTNWTARWSDIERRLQFIKLWSDLTFICPMVFQAPFFANKTNMDQGARLYMYEFAHQDGRFANWAGVPHAAEVPYVFGVPLFYPEAFSDTSNPLIVGTYPGRRRTGSSAS